MDQYQYNGSWGWFDFLKCVPNAAGKIYNAAIAGTWNSGVDTYNSLKNGGITGYLNDLYREAKGIATNVKDNIVASYDYVTSVSAGQFLQDFGNYITQPERLEDALLYYSGTRIPISKGKGSLLKPTSKEVPVANKSAIEANGGNSGAAKVNSANQKVHSKYSDGIKILEGEQPSRIKGPDPAAQGNPHTVLKWDTKNNRIYKARTYASNGQPVKDIDFTLPTFPNGTPRPNHTVPEQHQWLPNPSGGTPKRGKGEPLKVDLNSGYDYRGNHILNKKKD